jgi:hypothetical protein
MAQKYQCDFSSLTSYFCRSDKIVNQNIIYRRFNATFKYLNEVLYYNRVHVKKCEL